MQQWFLILRVRSVMRKTLRTSTIYLKDRRGESENGSSLRLEPTLSRCLVWGSYCPLIENELADIDHDSGKRQGNLVVRWERQEKGKMTGNLILRGFQVLDDVVFEFQISLEADQSLGNLGVEHER